MNISAAEFKTKCLSLMDQVQESHEEILITKHGKPVAKLVPVEKTKDIPLFGYLKGRMIEKGDIVKSLDIKWDAQK